MQRIITAHSRQLAAVIVEPLCLGSAGMRMYSPRYLAALSALCRRERVLLIVDEIAMGMGRTGRLFAFEHAGIDPDIVCLGKGLSGGYLPISATVVKQAIYATFTDRPADRTLYHGHTFTGNPIAAALAIEALAVYREENIVEKAAVNGDFMREALEPLASLPHVRAVRCLGLLGAVEFRKLKGGLTGAEQAQRVKKVLFDQHILIRPLGPVVYLMPPLTTSQRDLARLCRQFAAAVRSAPCAETRKEIRGLTGGRDQITSGVDDEQEIAFQPEPYGGRPDWSWRWKEQWIPHSAWLALALAAEAAALEGASGTKGE